LLPAGERSKVAEEGTLCGKREVKMLGRDRVSGHWRTIYMGTGAESGGDVSQFERSASGAEGGIVGPSGATRGYVSPSPTVTQIS
jgi:hypothetical protein